MDILEQFLRLVVVGEFFLLLLWMLASLVCMYVCMYVLQEEAFVFPAKKKKKKKLRPLGDSDLRLLACPS